MAIENQTSEQDVAPKPGADEAAAAAAAAAAELAAEEGGDQTPAEVELGELPPDLAPAPEATQEADGEGAAPKPKKHKGRGDARIQNLTSQLRETETVAERLKRENAELAARASQGTQQYEQASTAAMQHFKDAQTFKMQLAQRDLRDAIEAGDAQKQAELQTLIAGTQAELSNIAAWEQQQAAVKKNAPPKQEPAPQQQKPQQPGVDKNAMHADTQAWIRENSAWFEPGTDTFDPDMHSAAVAYAQLLDQRYIRQGKADQIGTRAYTQEIDRYMQQEFPDAFEGGDEDETPPAAAPPPRERTPPMQRRPEPVGASTRTLPNGAVVKTVNGKRFAVLTPEQKQMAHQLAANGALTMKDKDGRIRTRVTPEEGERIYAQQLINDPRNRQGAV